MLLHRVVLLRTSQFDIVSRIDFELEKRVDCTIAKVTNVKEQVKLRLVKLLE